MSWVTQVLCKCCNNYLYTSCRYKSMCVDKTIMVPMCIRLVKIIKTSCPWTHNAHSQAYHTTFSRIHMTIFLLGKTPFSTRTHLSPFTSCVPMHTVVMIPLADWHLCKWLFFSFQPFQGLWNCVISAASLSIRPRRGLDEPSTRS
jgi:hypothetical protein